MSGDLVIRRSVGAPEYPRLVEVWRTSVDATHGFLAAEHREEIQERLAADYLPQVALWVADRGGTPVGFAGTADGALEMLFVDAAHRGRGIGWQLLRQVLAADGVTRVDVNEQNEQALRFYRRAGFAVVGRSPLDGDGRPYPILHMALGR
ncbi:acetyltransferase [Brachybacterium sp. YJGR34]|uniref:acetyltransferase n=1 Tax=Brachybacterium sp. YJGR34 TaxID=2059911 RepID=UPI000E0B86F7|nr:acetyltransferase [Brachybacterium sp. YJGR34]